jgi:hypothetical protein
MYVCWELGLFLLELIEIFVLIFAELLAFFVIVKPDGYPIPAQSPTGTNMVQISTHGYEYVYGYEFLPVTFFVDGRVINLPDPNLT